MNPVPGQSEARRLTISQEEQEGETVVSLSGSVDMFTVVSLHDVLNPLCAREAAHIRVECSGLTYLNSSGVGALYNAHRKCTDSGGTLSLDAVPSKISELIHMLGLGPTLLKDPPASSPLTSDP